MVALRGIFTDGDLRRAIARRGGNNWADVKIAGVMTPSPQSCAPSLLADRALQQMREQSVNQLSHQTYGARRFHTLPQKRKRHALAMPARTRRNIMCRCQYFRYRRFWRACQTDILQRLQILYIIADIARLCRLQVFRRQYFFNRRKFIGNRNIDMPHAQIFHSVADSAVIIGGGNNGEFAARRHKQAHSVSVQSVIGTRKFARRTDMHSAVGQCAVNIQKQ